VTGSYWSFAGCARAGGAGKKSMKTAEARDRQKHVIFPPEKRSGISAWALFKNHDKIKLILSEKQGKERQVIK
jgi:hypothetical protein